jgi:molecular chaperone GrpE
MKDEKEHVKDEEAKKDQTEAQSETEKAGSDSVSADAKASEAVKTAESQKTDETEPAAEPTAEDKLAAAEKKVAALEAENADLKDQVLRRAADFDNYRKRMIQEKQDAFDFANTNLLTDLLDSIDNFERTVDAASTAKDVKSIADGVKMVDKSLVSMLENKYNLASYGVKGDSFDPDLHQAIGSSQGPVKTPVLAEVYLKGYKLKDKVIRHAKVMVTMPEEKKAGEKKADKAAEEQK